MKHKYGHSIKEILEKKETLQKQIAMFENRSEYLSTLDKKIDTAFSNYKLQAVKLSDARKKGKDKLDKEIISNLKDLSLPNAKFFTSIEETKPSANGIDKVEFLITIKQNCKWW